MPLAFDSLSHGKIAFGFFNIETDMILLEKYFLFAEDFSRYISDCARAPLKEIYQSLWRIYRIENSLDVGDLMGAIHGLDLKGFIGEVYKHFPFPLKKEAFKQNPEGFKTRSVVEELIRKYAEEREIQFCDDPRTDKIGIGEYLFDGSSFRELINYIWLGGFPQWKNGTRPEDVLRMKKIIEESERAIFRGLMLV